MRVGDELGPVVVATGADPAGRVYGAISELLQAAEDGGMAVGCSISHDDGCPCTDSKDSMAACTCELVELHVVRVS